MCPALVAIGVLVAVATLYLVWTRRARIGRRLPVAAHPWTPRPGTVPAMARWLRTRPQ
jgi:hypothetical protein